MSKVVPTDPSPAIFKSLKRLGVLEDLRKN